MHYKKFHQKKSKHKIHCATKIIFKKYWVSFVCYKFFLILIFDSCFILVIKFFVHIFESQFCQRTIFSWYIFVDCYFYCESNTHTPDVQLQMTMVLHPLFIIILWNLCNYRSLISLSLVGCHRICWAILYNCLFMSN